VDYLLAQVNIGRMREPLDSPLLADFAAALEPVNAAVALWGPSLRVGHVADCS